MNRAPKPPAQRLTLTFPAINAARAVVFLVAGEDKREALARVLAPDGDGGVGRLSRSPVRSTRHCREVAR